MGKKFSKIILSLICLLGFTASVNAASNSIYVYQTGTRYEYISGLPIYYNSASGYALYTLDSGTIYSYGTFLNSPEEVSGGYAYIINNSNVTGNTYKNYYIAQVAILWYEDYLNGNNANLSTDVKNSIKNNTNDTVCYYIVKLVEGAKNYNTNSKLIDITTENITFGRNGNYYYSNYIEVSVNGLSSKPTVSLYNAPSGTQIINNTVTNNGTGRFQIMVPVNSVINGIDRDFLVNITGYGYNYTYYKYSNYGVNEAIYSLGYNTNYGNVEDSIVVKLSDITSTNVRFRALNTNGNLVSDIKYQIYKGDCSNSTCDSSNLVSAFITNNTYNEFNGVLKAGTYTLVRLTETNYDFSKKEVINVLDHEYVQNFTINENVENDVIVDDENKNEDNKEENVKKYNVTIKSDLNDSTNIIKINDSEGYLIDSFRSNKETHKISLEPGMYCIYDTSHLMEIFFDLTDNGEIYVHIGSKKVQKSSINLSDYLVRYPVEDTEDDVKDKEDKFDEKEDIKYDENGNIRIDNFDGIDSIDISQKVETTTKVEWLNNIIDCPITSLFSTLKYVVGAIIFGVGAYLVVRNVKKNKNNS